MKKTNQPLSKSLRSRAEDILKSKLPLAGIPLSEADTLKLLHELQVHQIELELQQEELLKAKELEIRHESEERSRQALDYMLEGCQIIGFDWKYIYLNRSAEIQNHRPNDELIGHRYHDTWPGIEKTAAFQNIKQTLEERISCHFENKFLFPDGNFGWFDLSIQPVPEGVFILSIDITERKNAEEALRESKEKYQLISDNSEEWIYWVAPDGDLKYTSPAFERVTGYSPLEFTSYHEINEKIVHPADLEKVRQHTHLNKEDNRSHILDYRIITKTGEIRWISHSCSPLIGNSGEYLGRRGTNLNITQIKLNQEQLRESEFKFNRLFEEGPFGMAMVNSEFKFEKVNPAFTEMMGYTEEELHSLTIKDLTHPDDLTKDLHHVLKLINQEISVYKTEKRYIRKDGQVIWGSLTAMANYTSDRKFLYNLAIV